MSFTWNISDLFMSHGEFRDLQELPSGIILVNSLRGDEIPPNLVRPAMTRIYIADNERIQGTESLPEVLQYYHAKSSVSSNNLSYCLVVENNAFIEYQFVHSISTDKLFQELFDNIIIDLPGVQKQDFYVSISSLREVSAYAKKHQNSSDQCFLDPLMNLLSVASLSQRVTYQDDRYVFEIGHKTDDNSNQPVTFRISWGNLKKQNWNIFSKILNWVIGDGISKIDSSTRKIVARNFLLLRSQNNEIDPFPEGESINIPILLENMLEATLKERSVFYIESITKLKNDYIDSFKQQRELVQGAVTQSLTMVFGISAALYGLVITNGQKIPTSNFGVIRIISLFFAASAFVVLINFWCNLSDLEKFRYQLTNYYSLMIGVSKKNIESIYPFSFPELSNTWLLPILILFVLIVLLIYCHFNPEVINTFY